MDFMDIIGVDKGTTYTKTDKCICIRSTLRYRNKNDINLDNDKIIVEFCGKEYVAGEKGNYSTDLMKAKQYNTKIFILLAIGLSKPYQNTITTNVVSGLPIGLYASQKKILKEMLQETSNEININGERKVIRIKNAESFPEAAGAFYSQTEYEDGLVIDIGGLSVDTALFKKKKLIKFSTYSMGVMKLYSKLANKINSEYDLSKSEWDMEELINDGLYIHGKQVDLGIDDLCMEHCKEIFERLSLEYDLKSIRNISLTGSSAQWIYKYFVADIPQLRVMKQSMYANAIGYGNIGKVLFG